MGAIAATRVYDAFGAELSATGTWKGPFGYAGGFGYQEDSSGLKLLGHRYYDPTTGRFLSRDPIKDGHNWYVYSSNSPITNVDANGLSPDPMIALEATWFPFRNLGKGAKGQVIVDGGRNTPIGPHTQLGWRNGGYGASAHVYPQARTIGRSPNGSWVVERMIDFSDHGRPWDHDIVHAHEYTPSRGGAVKVPGRWTPVPAPRNGPIAPIGGTRNPGSGGGLGAFVSVAMGLEALAQGAGHVFKWRFMIDSAQSGADYAADGESEAEAAAYARLVGAEE